MSTSEPVTLTPDTLATWPLPDPGSSKDDRGSVLVVGGARTTPGAVALAGLAALRVGAGRITLAVGESAASALAVAFPEAAVIGRPETTHGAVRGDAVARLDDELDVDCVLLGPGLDDADEAVALLRRIRPSLGAETVVILDAFGLGALSHLPEFSTGLEGRLVFTPNVAEAAILLDVDEADPETAPGELARRHGAAVTCQGRISDGRQDFIAPGGGPILGTAGSGDVLAGAIAGLTARGLSPLAASCWGTVLHASSGDRLAERMGTSGALAREFADEFPMVLQSLERSGDETP